MLKVEDAPVVRPLRKLMLPPPAAALAAPVKLTLPVKVVLVEAVTASEAACCVPVPWKATTPPEVTASAPRRVAPTFPPIVMAPVPAVSVSACVPSIVLAKLMSPAVAPVEIATPPVARLTGSPMLTVAPVPCVPPAPGAPPAAVSVLALSVIMLLVPVLRPIVPAAPPLLPALVEAPPLAVMFATAIVPLTVSIVTAPPALPVAVACVAPVDTKSPARFTVPVPLTLMSINPEIAPEFAAAVVVMSPAAVLLKLPAAVATKLPPSVVRAALTATAPVLPMGTPPLLVDIVAVLVKSTPLLLKFPFVATTPLTATLPVANRAAAPPAVIVPLMVKLPGE